MVKCLIVQAQEESSLLSLWSLTSDCTWLDFIDLRQPRARPVPFVEATPGCVWMTAVPPSGPVTTLFNHSFLSTFITIDFYS